MSDISGIDILVMALEKAKLPEQVRQESISTISENPGNINQRVSDLQWHAPEIVTKLAKGVTTKVIEYLTPVFTKYSLPALEGQEASLVIYSELKGIHKICQKNFLKTGEYFGSDNT